MQKLCLAITKDAKNPFFKSSYISLDNIVSTLTPHLNRIWLVVWNYTKDRNVNTRVVDVDWTEQDFIESSFPLIESNDPQKLGSCISYAKRYNLSQLFNLVTDRDDDGNAASVPALAKTTTSIEDAINNVKTKEGLLWLSSSVREILEWNDSTEYKDSIKKLYNEKLWKLS